jgi:hypothetical protein
MKTVFERLAKRLKDDLLIEVDPDSFSRTYASAQQLAAGAPSWTAKSGYFTVLSSWPASECIKKCNHLEMGQG